MSQLKAVTYAVLGGCVGGAVVWLAQGHSFNLRPDGMSYADFAGILLTAASLIVAIAGFAVALLGLWGYTQFQKIVTDGTRQAVIEVAPGLLTAELRDGESRKVLIGLVAKYYDNEVAQPGAGAAFIAARERDLAALREVDNEDRDD